MNRERLFRMDQRAFLLYINPLKDRIFRLAQRYLISKDSAEDATQEVILKLWKLRKKLTSYDNPEAYAITMTKNHCLDQLRLKSNNNLRIVHNNLESRSQSLEKELEAKDELAIVTDLIKTLSQQEQTLIQLRDIEQMEYAEMAKILEMNETAIRVGLSRARKKLRTKILKIHRYGIASD